MSKSRFDSNSFWIPIGDDQCFSFKILDLDRICSIALFDETNDNIQTLSILIILLISFSYNSANTDFLYSQIVFFYLLTLKFHRRYFIKWIEFLRKNMVIILLSNSLNSWDKSEEYSPVFSVVKEIFNAMLSSVVARFLFYCMLSCLTTRESLVDD